MSGMGDQKELDKENAEPSTRDRVSKEEESTEVVGVPPELLVKHPLQYRWSLWYCRSERNRDWEECLKCISSFDTVEDFWALYNHIQVASCLPQGSDYYLFKEGIKPMWEDPQNIEGGRWLLQVLNKSREKELDQYWLELLMAIIGEQFEDKGEQICGAVVNVRQKGDKISLWTRNKTDEAAVMKIGQIMKALLSLPGRICYESHQESKHKKSSAVQMLYSVGEARDESAMPAPGIPRR